MAANFSNVSVAFGWSNPWTAWSSCDNNVRHFACGRIIDAKGRHLRQEKSSERQHLRG
jgi:hypothetical protein